MVLDSKVSSFPKGLVVTPILCLTFLKSQADKIPKNIALGAIIRNGRIEIPNHHTHIYPDDELLLFTKPENIPSAERLFR